MRASFTLSAGQGTSPGAINPSDMGTMRTGPRDRSAIQSHQEVAARSLVDQFAAEFAEQNR